MTNSAVDRAHVTPTRPGFSPPYDWDAIDEAVRNIGYVVIERLLDREGLARLNVEIDTYLASTENGGRSATVAEEYDRFLGHRTLRVHGLTDKLPSSASLIGDPELVAWASRHITDGDQPLLLNAAELIEIQPGEPAQLPHRDTDSWPVTVVNGRPVIVHAVVALDDFTLDNGATYVAPGSWDWDAAREPTDDEWERAVMRAGDALLFRGDLVHRGGENNSSARRRAISVAYCAGWLRPVKNSYLTTGPETAGGATDVMQSVLGDRAYSGTPDANELLGLDENGDPARFLDELASSVRFDHGGGVPHVHGADRRTR